MGHRVDKYMYKETKIRILMTRFFTDGSFASPYFKELTPTLGYFVIYRQNDSAFLEQKRYRTLCMVFKFLE